MRENCIQHSMELHPHHPVTRSNPNWKSLQHNSPLVVVLLLVISTFSGCRATAALSLTESEELVVQRFRSYLQIDTAHPDPDYAAVNKFLLEQGEQIGLDVKVIELTPGKPVLVLTWKGTDASLPSIILNSHTDVVPAEELKWAHPPFSAHIDEEGRVFARGSQDMKSVGMQYLEAIRNLRAAGFNPRRTVHVAYVPDEEIGSDDGAKKFVQSDEFKALDVAFVLDEGLPSLGEEFRVFNGEKTHWWFVVKAAGSPAHGSRLFDGMAAHNLRETLNKIEDFRTVQFEKLKSGEAVEGEVVSISNVFLKAGTPTPTGFVMNLQPSEAEAGFDMRLPPFADTDYLQKLILEEWAPPSHNLTVSFIHKRDVKNKFGEPAVTPTDETNPWWALLKAGVANAGGHLSKPEILMGCTDSRFVRFEGIPALGFSPLANTPLLLHGHNECLHVKEYLKGIPVYQEIIKSLSGSEFEVDTANAHASKR